MFIFRIKEIREKKHITQKELSKKTGISRNYITELENNMKPNPSFETIYKIAQGLEVEIKEVFVAVSDIEQIRKVLYEAINKHGINSKYTLVISNLMNNMINLEMLKIV